MAGMADVNAMAQQKLKEHNGFIDDTYNGMPGYLTLELPPGTLPPEQKPPTNPNPNPNPDRGTPSKGAPYSGPGSHNSPGGVPNVPGSTGPGSSLASSGLPSGSTANTGIDPTTGLPIGTQHGGGTDLSGV